MHKYIYIYIYINVGCILCKEQRKTIEKASKRCQGLSKEEKKKSDKVQVNDIETVLEEIKSESVNRLRII